MSGVAWRTEFEELRMERAAARRRAAHASGQISDRAHEAFGLVKVVQEHPFVAAGVAGAGVLLVKVLADRIVPKGGKARVSDKDDWASTLADVAPGLAKLVAVKLLTEIELAENREPDPPSEMPDIAPAPKRIRHKT